MAVKKKLANLASDFVDQMMKDQAVENAVKASSAMLQSPQQRRINEAFAKVGNFRGMDQVERLRRAQDEGADLSLFTPRALEKAINPEQGHLLTALPPGQFQDFAARIPQDTLVKRPYTLAYQYYDPNNPMNSLSDVLRKYGEAAKSSGWHDVPELRFDSDPAFQSLSPGMMTQQDYPVVRSHEGRHRSMAADRYLKQPKQLTVIKPTQEALDHLRYQNYDEPGVPLQRLLEMQNRKVLPETQSYIPMWERGLTEDTLPQLPELFDEGGKVVKGALSTIKHLAEGKPKIVKLPGVGEMPSYPIREIEDIASGFAKKYGNPYPIESFAPYDKERAKKIADAFEEMRHDPHSYAVKRAYEALSDETMDQYKALKPLGIDFNFLKPGEGNPYKTSPSLGYHDLLANNRMKVFPTLQPGAFGTLAEVENNPLLKRIGPVGDMPEGTVNDAFRIVHDIYGHYGPGNPFFRAPGEDRAWKIHGRSFSPDALPAATTELRGQNSWLNEGPHGAFNRTANQDDTIYADQKVGLLPRWVMEDKAEGGPVGYGHEDRFGNVGGYSHVPQFGPMHYGSVGMKEGGDWMVKFVKNLASKLEPEKQEALGKVGRHTLKTGNEGLIYGRVGDPELSALVKGTPTSAENPPWEEQFIKAQLKEPYFTAHTHPNNSLSPSTGDLQVWGNRRYGDIGMPWQEMLINAQPQNSVLQIGTPGRGVFDPKSFGLVSDVMKRDQFYGDLSRSGIAEPYMNDFLKGSGIAPNIRELASQTKMMPSIASSRGYGMLYPDIEAGSFLNDVARMGVPIDVSAEHRLTGTPHLASDVWPELDKWLRSKGVLDNTMNEGGPVEMADGGPSLKKIIRSFVRKPTNDLYSHLYGDPRDIAREAAERIAPENPMMKQLFGMGREDLYNEYAGQPGNVAGMDLLPPSKRARGSEAVSNIMTPANEQRLIDVMAEAQRYPQIIHGADPWYAMDPAYQRLVQLRGQDEADRLYHRFNVATGSMSPASPVDQELVRGTIANHLLEQGKYADLKDWGGIGHELRGGELAHMGNVPESMRDFPAHPYFTSAVLPSLERNLWGSGTLPTKPKVPLYIGASNVESLGRQSDIPVPDRHFARAVGLTNTRTSANPDAPVSMAEARAVGPWFRDKVARPMGMEGVPAQARTWTVFGPQTGVETMLGKPKLEILSDLIEKRASERGISPEDMRDLILTGQGYAEGGEVDDSPFLSAQPMSAYDELYRGMRQGYPSTGRPMAYTPYSDSLRDELIDSSDRFKQDVRHNPLSALGTVARHTADFLNPDMRLRDELGMSGAPLDAIMMLAGLAAPGLGKASHLAKPMIKSAGAAAIPAIYEMLRQIAPSNEDFGMARGGYYGPGGLIEGVDDMSDIPQLPDDPSWDAYARQRSIPHPIAMSKMEMPKQGGDGGGGGLGQLLQLGMQIAPMFLNEGGPVGYAKGGAAHDILGTVGSLANYIFPGLGILGKFAGNVLGDVFEGNTGEIGDDAQRDFTLGIADPDAPGGFNPGAIIPAGANAYNMGSAASAFFSRGGRVDDDFLNYHPILFDDGGLVDDQKNGQTRDPESLYFSHGGYLSRGNR